MNNVPTVFINHRIVDRNGELIGVAGVGMALKSIPQIVERLGNRYRQHVVFTDIEGTIITRSDYSAFQIENLYEIPDAESTLDDVFAGDSLTFEFEHDGDTTLFGARAIPELGWWMFVEQNEKIALERIQSPLIAVVTVYLVTLLATLILLHLTVHFFHTRLETMATTDLLTGVSNRSVFEYSLGQAFSRRQRGASAFSVLLIDLDRFKQVNDIYGHLKGDEALRKTVGLIKQRIRSSDELCRWGGEEFEVLMQDCTHQQSLELAEKLRRWVEEGVVIQFPDGSPLTISIGVASIEDDDTVDALLSRVDAALYKAKNAGRNRVYS